MSPTGMARPEGVSEVEWLVAVGAGLAGVALVGAGPPGEGPLVIDPLGVGSLAAELLGTGLARVLVLGTTGVFVAGAGSDGAAAPTSPQLVSRVVLTAAMITPTRARTAPYGMSSPWGNERAGRIAERLSRSAWGSARRISRGEGTFNIGC